MTLYIQIECMSTNKLKRCRIAILKGGRMNSAEYVEACKVKLGCDSYYKLAKLLEIVESDLTFYRHGQRTASAYAAFKFAECLGLDPAIVVADIASEAEKNPIKRDYFKSFMSRCAKTLAALILMGGLCSSQSAGDTFAV